MPVLLALTFEHGPSLSTSSGVRSNNIHVVDTASDPRAPCLHKVIDGAEIKAKANLSVPHGALSWAEIIISFLGNAKGEAPGLSSSEQGF